MASAVVAVVVAVRIWARRLVLGLAWGLAMIVGSWFAPPEPEPVQRYTGGSWESAEPVADRVNRLRR